MATDFRKLDAADAKGLQLVGEMRGLIRLIDYEEAQRRRDWFIFCLVFIFMTGQIISALLNLFGWPSDWF